ncbi:MAG: winged helix-turn-helix transcriptional regulator [Candidatus Methanofastidiosia archaeon]
MKRTSDAYLAGMVLVLLISPVAAYSSEITTITIQLNSTGSAQWTVEDRIVLATEEDEKLFEEFEKDETLKEEKLNEFKEKMNILLEKIKYSTNRSMNMTDFEIFMGKEVTVTNTYGVIRFRFTWEHFAITEGDRIIMGDAFEGGYYLSKNEILVVEFPETFRLVTAAPPPDHQKETILIWEGPMNFNNGHPAVLVERQETSAVASFWLLPVLAGVLIFAVFMILRTRQPHLEKEKSSPYVDDKQLIIEAVKQHGGTIPQKELSDLTGFSKAKTSILLKELKKEGIIKKTFRGRENEIVLIDTKTD